MRYLAIDLGLKRIGLALSLDSKIVIPIEAIIRKNRNQASNEVKKVLDEWKIDKIVVGIPLGGSSQEEMQKRIEHFIKLLQTDKEVIYQDESGTSVEAKELIKGEMKHIKDGRIDSIAAMLILKRYLKII
jgi:putative Holliday junction resolvase